MWTGMLYLDKGGLTWTLKRTMRRGVAARMKTGAMTEMRKTTPHISNWECAHICTHSGTKLSITHIS